MKSSTFARTAALALLSALAACGDDREGPADAAPAVGAEAPDRKAQVVALLKSIETGETAPAAVIDAGRYTQHNLAVADGLAGFGALLAQLPPGSARVHTVRVFEDGDFVFAHTEYNFFGPKIGFDVFRFENGKIVEHWDNLQETPAGPNPSGRTMTDGPTEATGREGTAANKALVAAFLDDVIVHGEAEKIGDYLLEGFAQHNPLEADGVDGLGAFLAAQAGAGTPLSFDRVHHVYGEGNFVLSVSEGSFGGRHSSFYDLFRVEGGKIVEHWDVLQAVPEVTVGGNSPF